MCWVALDRGLRLADKRSFPADRGALARRARRDLRGHHDARAGATGGESFVQYYGGDTLDASNLLMPLVFFVSPDDPKMLETLGAISRVRRARAAWSPTASSTATTPTNPSDGLTGHEGTFNCAPSGSSRL